MAAMMSSAVSVERGAPERATTRYGLLPATRPIRGGDVRYARTAESRWREAGITFLAVFTAGSRARESWGSSGRRRIRTPSSPPAAGFQTLLGLGTNHKSATYKEIRIRR